MAHHPDGGRWPRQQPGGSEVLLVVVLEVQMHADSRFHRRLGAQTFRLLQQHEEVAHLQVLVLLTHQRLALVPASPACCGVFSRRTSPGSGRPRPPSTDIDPLLALLTLPVQKEPDLGPCAQRILALRPDLIELIVPILSERFQGLSPSQIMATLGISKDFWRHTRAFQDILAEGRQEGVELGRQEGREQGRELGLEEGLEEGRRRQASALALRQLERRCGSLEVPTSSRIEALSLPQLEELALALLDFRGAQDLQTWLEQLEP